MHSQLREVCEEAGKNQVQSGNRKQVLTGGRTQAGE